MLDALNTLALFIGYAVLAYVFLSAIATLVVHFVWMRPALRAENSHIVEIWESNFSFGFGLLWEFLLIAAFSTALRGWACCSKSFSAHLKNWYDGEVPTLKDEWAEVINRYWSKAETG